MNRFPPDWQTPPPYLPSSPASDGSPGWPSAWQPNGQHWGDMRERLARLEVASTYARDRLESQSARLHAMDGRVQALGGRVSTIEAKAPLLAELEKLPKKLEATEQRRRMIKDLAQYAAGAILLAAAIAGKVSWEQVGQIVLKLFGAG